MTKLRHQLNKISEFILILPILASLAQTIGSKILQSPAWGDGWGAARLAPTFALWHGFPLYAPIDSGAVLNTVYPPLTYLIYFPAVLSSDITNAIMLATAIAVAVFLVPVFLILFKRDAIFVSILLFAAFCLFSLYSAPLIFSGYSIHADAPALGFAALAALIICKQENRSDQKWLNYLSSAIFAVAAVWTKQTMLPILMAIPVYLWLQNQKEAIAYSKYLIISLVIISAGLTLIFGSNAMFYNIIAIPSAHPWRSSDRIQILFSASIELIQNCAIPLVILSCCSTFKAQKLGQNRINMWSEIWNRSSVLYLIIAIFLIPTTLLGRVKMGGVENTLSPTIYFLAIASLLAIGELIEQSGKKWLKWLLMAIITGATVIQTLPFNTLGDLVRSLPQNPQAVAYRYAKNHGGEVYFPFHPLVHLFAESKLYHFHYGLFDRQLAGDRISNIHFQAYIPNQLKLVAFPPKFPSRDLRKSPPMQYLSQFSEKISLPELPEWTIFARPDSNSDQDQVNLFR